jgi:hypothetical protein
MLTCVDGDEHGFDTKECGDIKQNRRGAHLDATKKEMWINTNGSIRMVRYRDNYFDDDDDDDNDNDNNDDDNDDNDDDNDDNDDDNDDNDDDDDESSSDTKESGDSKQDLVDPLDQFTNTCW